MKNEVVNKMIKKLTPKTYLEQFYPESGFCTKTVINWIKRGKLNGEQTPTGRWLVVIDEQESAKVNVMLKMLEISGV
tara:strand:- start:1276 stop:1506 length:231 start_codon:yes stop_codon:yes gene_type:complete